MAMIARPPPEPLWPPPPEATRGDPRDAAPLQTWLEAARRIAARHDLPAAEPTLYPTGSDIVLRLGEVVLKLTLPRWEADLRTEASLLARVRGRLPVATPTLLAAGALDGWPYVLMSRVDGVALAEVWPTLAAPERRALAAEIGELIAALQALEVPPEEGAAWPPFLDGLRAGAEARLRGRHEPGPEPLLAQITPFLADTSLSERPLVWLHTELLDQHLLLRSVAGRWRLAALIDFADARVGHPLYELPALAEFVLRGEAGLLGPLLDAAGLGPWSPALSRELCAWSLLHRFGSVARMARAVGEPAPRGLEELGARLYGA